MKLRDYFSNFITHENKIIYLIFFLPMSIVVGSLVNNIFIFLIILFFVLEIIKKKINILKNKEFIVFFIFYIYLILNSLFLTQTLEGITRAVGFVRFPLLALAIAYYFSIENYRYEKKILTFWLFSFLIVTIDIIFEFFIGFNLVGIKSNYPGRVASFTGDEIKIGGFYFGFFLICLSSILKYKKNFFFLMVLIFLTTSMLIGEKSNFIKIFFVITLLFHFILDKKLIRKLYFLLVFLFITVFTINYNQNLRESFLGDFPLVEKSRHIGHAIYPNFFSANKKVHVKKFKDNLFSNRHILHYVTAYEMFKKNIFFGVGIKNFRHESYKKKYNPIKNVNGGTTHPHQIHFELALELEVVVRLLLFRDIFFTAAQVPASRFH